MKRNICILLILLVCISLWANEKTEKHIYIVDLSGSMAGYKTTINVFNKEKRILSESLLSLNKNIEVSIIPFAENILPILHGNGEELSVLVKSFKVYPGNSNIYTAWIKGINEIDSNKNNKLFLISDGLQNTGCQTTKFIEALNVFSAKALLWKTKAYFVALDSTMENTEVAMTFKRNDNMFIIKDLNTEIIEQSKKSTTHMPSETYIKQNKAQTTIKIKEKNTLDNLDSIDKYIVGIIILICILIITLKYIDIDFIISEFGYQKGERNILPRDNPERNPKYGYFTGEKGESNYMLAEKPHINGSNKEGLSGKELLKNPMSFYNYEDCPNKYVRKEIRYMMRKRGKEKGIPYKNKRPNFYKWTIPLLFIKITDNRIDNEMRAITKLAKRWHCSIEEASYYKAQADLTFHETIINFMGFKIGCVYSIPTNIHENARHSGGVSDAKQ